MKVKFIFFLFVISFLLHSCKKGVPSWETDITAPIIHFSLDIDNLIPDSLMQTDANNAITLVFDKKIYELALDSMVSFHDTNSALYFFSPVTGVLQPGQSLVNSTDIKKFNFGSAQLSSIKVKHGSILVKYSNSLLEKVDVSYTFPNSNLNGSPFSIHEILPSHADNPNPIYKTYDISGCYFDLTGLNHNAFNTTVIHGVINIDANAQPVNVNAFDNVVMSSTFNDIEIGFAKGYFGSSTYEIGPEITNLGLFRNIRSGNLQLNNVSMKLLVHNGLGVDARALLKSFWSMNSFNQNTISLNSPLINQPLNISRAIETNQIGQAVQASDYVYDFSNSNVAALLENFPDYIGYHLQISSNPLGNVSSGDDFYYDGNPFSASLQIEVPLSMIASDLVVADTNAFIFSTGNVNSGQFYITVINGFPLSANLELKLFDNHNIQIHTLMANQLISPAILGTNGKVTENTKSIVVISLNELDMYKLKNTSRICSYVKFNTMPQASAVRIYKDYKMDITVSGNFNFTIQ